MSAPDYVNVIYSDKARSEGLAHCYQGHMLSPGRVIVNGVTRDLIMISEEIETNGQQIVSVLRRFQYAGVK